MKKILLGLLFSALVAGLRGQTSLQDINNFETYSDEYNLIAFGSATFNGSSDTQGGIAVDGTLTFGGNWTIASNVSAGTNPSLYANGQVVLNNNTVDLNNGFASTPHLSSQTWNWSNNSLSDGSNVLHINSGDQSSNPITTPAPIGFNWATEQSDYDAISTSLDAMTATGTISVSGQNLDFNTSQTSGVVVFDLNASLLSGNSYNGQIVSNVQIDVPSGVAYVINVTNLAANQVILGNAINFNSGTNDNQLLWNIEGDQTVTIGDGGNFYGSILAPQSTVAVDTTISGQVVADDYVDSGVELHDEQFDPGAVLVPEVPYFGLGTMITCMFAVAYSSARRKFFPSAK